MEEGEEEESKEGKGEAGRGERERERVGAEALAKKTRVGTVIGNHTLEK